MGNTSNMSLEEKNKRPKMSLLQLPVEWVPANSVSLPPFPCSYSGCYPWACQGAEHGQSCWITAPHHFYLFKTTIIFEGCQRGAWAWWFPIPSHEAGAVASPRAGTYLFCPLIFSNRLRLPIWWLHVKNCSCLQQAITGLFVSSTACWTTKC